MAGRINPRLREAGPIRVVATAHAAEVDVAISRWNTALNRTLFQRVTSGIFELRVSYRTGSACSGYSGFKAIHVTQAALDQGGCGTTGPSHHDWQLDLPSVILIDAASFDALSAADQQTGMTHEMGHALGLADHYYAPLTPGCRSDVVSIMENWGCEGITAPTADDVFDIKRAYEVQGGPFENIIWGAAFWYDLGDYGTAGLHNERAVDGARWRKKAYLEGTVLESGYQSRRPLVSSYWNYFYNFDYGERCYAANGINNYQGTHGPDGSETCYNWANTIAGDVLFTSDTKYANDFFRLWNYSGATLTEAQLTYTNGAFIAWITTPGQPAGIVSTTPSSFGQAYSLPLPKGAYQARYKVLGVPYIQQVGLDD